MTEQDAQLYSNIGARIRERRLKLNMSQSELGELAHVAASHISDIELGKRQVRLATFVRIAEALQTSADQLILHDVPETKKILLADLDEMLQTCSASEHETVIRVVRELISSMHTAKPNSD